MRLLQVIASADPRTGGPIEWVLRNADAVAAMGHQTEVLTLDAPGEAWAKGFPLPLTVVGPAMRRYGYTPRLVPWLRAHACDFDVTIVNGLWNYSSLGTWRALAGGPVRYFVVAHGMLDPWFRQHRPVKHWVKLAFWLAAEGRVLRDARRVIFISEEERQRAEGAFRGHDFRGCTIACGTADPPGVPGPQIAAFRAALPRLGARPFLLFLGRLHPKKGCDLLLSAFTRIAGAHPDLDLVMAGPDQVGWRAALIHLSERLGIGGRVHWPGMLAGDVKWGALHAAEAFVLPSHQENFGIAVAEALACNTPVLITEKVNIWRDVAASGGGLVGSDTEAGIAALIEQFLGLPAPARATMRVQARRCFQEHFDIHTAARDLLCVVEERA